MLSKSLEETLRRAMTNASSLKHEFATLEHLLFALLKDHQILFLFLQEEVFYQVLLLLTYSVFTPIHSIKA